MKLISVQALRGIGALLVVIHHIIGKLVATSSIESDFFVGYYRYQFGTSGIDLFFIISGFIMMYITDGKTVNLFSFMKKRFFRIFPLYWILTFVAIVGSMIVPSMVNSSSSVKSSIFYSLTLLPLPSADLDIFVRVGWTLRYELLFYLLFTLSLLIKKNLRTICLLTLLVALTLLPNEHDNYVITFLSSNIIWNFCFGILSFLILKHINVKPLVSLLLFISSIIIVIYFFHIGSATYNRFALFSLPMFLLFLSITSGEKWLSGYNLTKILAKVGEASYSIYLSHVFFISIFSFIINKIPLLQNTFFFIVLTLIGSVAGGFAIYYLLEYRINNYLKKL